MDNPLRDMTDSGQLELERARLAAYPYLLVADCEPYETDDDQPGEQQTDTNESDSDTTERKRMADNSISQTVAPEIGRASELVSRWVDAEMQRVRRLLIDRFFGLPYGRFGTPPTVREFQRQARIARHGAAIRQWRRSR